MISKVTRKDKEKLLYRLKETISKLEFGDNQEAKRYIQAWQRYQNLSQTEKYRLHKEWDAYYAAVKETPAYAIFQEQRKLLNFTDIDWMEWDEQMETRKTRMMKAKELGAEAKLMLLNGDAKTVKKPSSIDPWEFSGGYIKDYQNLQKQIKELQIELSSSDDAQEVWA